MDTRIFKNTLNISRILKTFYKKLSDNFYISKEETEVLLYCLKFVDMLNLFMNQQSIDSLNKIIYDINELVLMINNIESKDIILKKIRYTEMTVIYYKKKMFKNLFFGDGNALGQEIERCLDLVTLSGSFDQKLFKQMQNVFYVVQTRIEESYRSHIQERFNEMKIISVKHKKGRYNCYEEFDDYADYKNFSHHDKDTQDYYDNFNDGGYYPGSSGANFTGNYGSYASAGYGENITGNSMGNSIVNSNINPSVNKNYAYGANDSANYHQGYYDNTSSNYYGGYNSSYAGGKTGSNTSGKFKKTTAGAGYYNNRKGSYNQSAGENLNTGNTENNSNITNVNISTTHLTTDNLPVASTLSNNEESNISNVASTTSTVNVSNNANNVNNPASNTNRTANASQTYQVPKIDDTMEIVTTVQAANPKTAHKNPQNYYNDNFYKNYVYYYDKNSPQPLAQNACLNMNNSLATKKNKNKNKKKTGGIAQPVEENVNANLNTASNSLNNVGDNNPTNNTNTFTEIQTEINPVSVDAPIETTPQVNKENISTSPTANFIEIKVPTISPTDETKNLLANEENQSNAPLIDAPEVISVQVTSKGKYSNPNYKGNQNTNINYKYGTNYTGANTSNYYNSYNNNYAPNYNGSKYYPTNNTYQQGKKENYYNYANNVNSNSNYYNNTIQQNNYSNTKTYKNEVDNNINTTINSNIPQNNPLSNCNSNPNPNTNLLNYRKQSNTNSSANSSTYNNTKYGKNKRESYGYSSGGNSGKYKNHTNGLKHEFVDYDEINNKNNSIKNPASSITSPDNTGSYVPLVEEALPKEEQFKLNSLPGVNNIPKDDSASKVVSSAINNLVDIDVEMMFAHDKEDQKETLASVEIKDNTVTNANVTVNSTTNNIPAEEYDNLAADIPKQNEEVINSINAMNVMNANNSNNTVAPLINEPQGSESFEHIDEEDECDDSVVDEMEDVEDLNDEEINEEINRLRNEEDEEEDDSDSVDNEMIEAEFDKFIRESNMVGANKNFSEDYYADREKETKNNKVIFEDDTDININQSNAAIQVVNNLNSVQDPSGDSNDLKNTHNEDISEQANKEENENKNVNINSNTNENKEENSNTMKETTRNFMESLKNIDPQVLMEIRGKLNEEGKKTDEISNTANTTNNTNMNMNMNMMNMQSMASMQGGNIPTNLPPNYDEFMLHQRQYNKVPIQNYIFSNYAHFFYRGRDANIHREYFALKCLEQENSSLVTKNIEQFENKVLIPIYQRINFNVNKKRGVYFYTFTKYKKLIYRILGKDKILKKVKPYGSYMNNFLIDSGDIDICIVPKCGILEFSNHLEKIKEEIMTMVKKIKI
jgi:hypothetical protein